VTLRTRLLLSSVLLSLVVTISVALLVRNAWHQAEETRFAVDFKTKTADLEQLLGQEGDRLSNMLAPICKHDPIVDSALVGLSSDSLDTRLLSLRARVPELQKSLGLQKLQLVSSKGAVIAGDATHSVKEAKGLTESVLSAHRKPGFRKEPHQQFQAACLKKRGDQWVALFGATDLDQLLEDFGTRHSLSLERELSENDDDTDLQEVVQLKALGGLSLSAHRDRLPLEKALTNLNTIVLSAAFVTLLGAFVFALFLTRGLARPVTDFARRTREAVSGDVQELPVTGGPELEQAARDFNDTLEDLRGLRQRLVLTERIAARREVARQIAHEIKNPLSPIRTSIETLRKLKKRDHPEFDSYFDETTTTVLTEVNRIKNLVSSFSEYASLPAPKRAPLDLGALAEELTTLHQDLGARIGFSKEDTPEISADRDQIAQVLTNLIKNAIEATSGQESKEVMVELINLPESEGKWVELSVADNGSGIANEMKERLFQPYATTKKEGTGLGLPISHRIAVEHGGDLTYTNSSAGGACFVLLLPTFGPPTLGDNA